MFFVENIYQAPEAEIVGNRGSEKDDLFYVVSAKKFWLLFIFTFGMYYVYWFYRHWAIYKKRTGEKLWPVMRAIFTVFFTHRLYDNFSSHCYAAGNRGVKSLKGEATLLVLLVIISNMIGRMTTRGVGYPYLDIVELLLTPVLGALVWLGQKVANLACGDPDGSSNSRLTVVNWIWLVLGGLFWLMVIAGIFLPEDVAY